MTFSALRCRSIYMMFLLSPVALSQLTTRSFSSSLDPKRPLHVVQSEYLPEEYIWTAGEATSVRPDRDVFPWSRQDLRTNPHFFREHFTIGCVPAHATLYVAGPRDAQIYLNGRLLAHFSSDIDAPIGIHVYHEDAQRLLRAGANVLAIRAVRGRGIVSADASAVTSQLTYGEVLAVKLVSAGPNRPGRSLLVSSKDWRSANSTQAASLEFRTSSATPQWFDPSFQDNAWPATASLGPIESNRDFRQWSADAGMYAWPGYQGISSMLRTYTLQPANISHVFEGQATLAHLESLVTPRQDGQFTIATPEAATTLTDAERPSLLLDFGREIAGRIVLRSNSNQDSVISIAYGESELEALATGLTSSQKGGNYLGTNLLEVPAHGEGRGPKSAFRYVRLRFLRGGDRMVFPEIKAEAITYPVNHSGSFQSSDERLDRIWATGTYTVHLCMQDDLWDAPKRDRGRWAGDIDVEGRVISDVFGDTALLEQTLNALASHVGSAGVNGIPNYSALWITSLASLYAHSGDLEFLRTQRAALTHVTRGMDDMLDPSGSFTNRDHHWLFIDWSPGLYGMTPQAVAGTNLQLIRGYRAAASLLGVLGDVEASERAAATADRMAAALSTLPRPAISLDHNWQLAALDIQTHPLSTEQRKQELWSDTFAHVKQDAPDDPVISPYFNASVIDAMSMLGHQREALDWIRTYWGGMLDEGATTFWESYDLRWAKDIPHLSLQADGTSGFFVSLAHGWSAGSTAWLTENILGIRDPIDGYRKFTLAPRLLGLTWAKGAVPTPHGDIMISMKQESGTVQIDLMLPSGIEGESLSLEPVRSGTSVLLDGQPTKLLALGVIHLAQGKHTLTYNPASP